MTTRVTSCCVLYISSLMAGSAGRSQSRHHHRSASSDERSSVIEKYVARACVIVRIRIASKQKRAEGNSEELRERRRIKMDEWLARPGGAYTSRRDAASTRGIEEKRGREVEKKVRS